MIDFLSPGASKARAIKLRKYKCKKVCKSLKYLVSLCDEVLAPNIITTAYDKFKEFNILNFTSGFIFYAVKSLTRAIEKEQVDVVRSIINFLINVVPENRISPKIIIGNEKLLGKEKFNFFGKLTDDVYNLEILSVPLDKGYLMSSLISSAFSIIRELDLELSLEIEEIVDEFYLFNSSSINTNEIIYSGSDFDKLGCIFINTCINEKGLLFLLDKIIHESAHQILLSIMINDEIVLNSDGDRFRSPLREGLRTVTGIYHAAFVIYRIIMFFRKLKSSKNFDDSYVESEIKKYENQFNDCYFTIKKHGKLTESGWNLINNCYIEIG